jgi:hypothetical protein
MLAVAVLLIGLSPAPAADGHPLAGRWLLTMPRGFEYDATLEPAGEPGLYRLRCGATNLAGLYEADGRQLRRVGPGRVRWDVLTGNALVLAEHPGLRVGADYRGATLGRQKAADAKAGRR